MITKIINCSKEHQFSGLTLFLTAVSFSLFGCTVATPLRQLADAFITAIVKWLTFPVQ